ncbi:porin [Parasutterella muris]|uniref:porin n=1 Tax=Parasutterella muris TaxID=2565572 RepID=UPI00203BA453|nr:porin [Parasutterella muris]
MKIFNKVFLSALLFPTVSLAGVQVYGILDTAILGQKVKGETATMDFTSGYSMGNRFGFKGQEELGGGYSVGFVLEQGFNVDTGTQFNTWSKNGVVQSGAFNRQSFLSLSGPFGKIAFGRFGALTCGTGDFNIARISAFGIGYQVGSYTSYTIDYSRVNNGIVYVSPSLNGLKISAAYSNGVTTDEAKWSENSHYYGIGALYTNKTVDASIIFESNDNKGSVGVKPIYTITAGGSCNFGVTKLFAGYQYGSQKDKRQQHVFLLSSATPLAGGVLKFGGKYLTGKLDGKSVVKDKEDKYNSWNVNAAYEYPLSKRTMVYGFAGYADGGKLLSSSESIAASGLGFKAIRVNGWQAAIGLNHKF